jgi:hypothetical protein
LLFSNSFLIIRLQMFKKEQESINNTRQYISSFKLQNYF